MTQAQRQKIIDLTRCAMQVGGYDKQFVGSMSAKPDDYELTERQARYLDSLHYKYRKQIAGYARAGFTTYPTEAQAES